MGMVTDIINAMYDMVKEFNLFDFEESDSKNDREEQNRLFKRHLIDSNINTAPSKKEPFKRLVRLDRFKLKG